MASRNIHMKLRPWSMWPYMCVLPTRNFIIFYVNETSDTTFPLFGIGHGHPMQFAQHNNYAAKEL